LEANGSGPGAKNAADAEAAIKANPAAKEITGAPHAQQFIGVNGVTAKSDSDSNSQNNARREASAMRSADMMLFAQAQGLGWAQNRPELMSLGKDALRTIAEAKLTEQQYQNYRDIGLNDKESVGVLKILNKNEIDARKFGDHAKKIKQSLPPEEGKAFLEATKQLGRDGDLRAYRERIEPLKANPRVSHDVEALQKLTETTRKAEAKASAAADTSVKRTQVSLSEFDASAKPAIEVSSAEKKPIDALPTVNAAPTP
jgi:hypothetical protein